MLPVEQSSALLGFDCLASGSCFISLFVFLETLLRAYHFFLLFPLALIKTLHLKTNSILPLILHLNTSQTITGIYGNPQIIITVNRIIIQILPFH